MFNRNKHEDTGLQTVIDAHIASMTDANDPEYPAKVDQLAKLYSLKEDTSKSKLSADTAAIVAGNLLGILTIVLAEKSSVITSVGKNFILKAR
jgi:hypothetical protein